MYKKITLAVALTLFSIPFLPFKPVYGETVLTEAVITKLENKVRLIQNQQARPARTSDRITPGDALSTAAQSKADLRFNEGSVARLGERAVFQFVRGTRSIDIKNGTALFLLPRGQGTTQIRTPNAAAGIRGSAIMIRVSPDNNTAVFIALTNSQIVVSNKNGTQTVELKGGQLAHFQGDTLAGVFDCDLVTLLETSPLVEGLDLTEISSDENDVLNVVRSEIIEAVEAQKPFSENDKIIVNPAFVALEDNSSEEFPSEDIIATEVVDFGDFTDQEETLNQIIANIRGNGNLLNLTEGGEFQAIESLQRNSDNNFPGGGATGGEFPGGGATGGEFPGGGATGGEFPSGNNGLNGLENALDRITNNPGNPNNSGGADAVQDQINQRQ
jgi:acrosin